MTDLVFADAVAVGGRNDDQLRRHGRRITCAPPARKVTCRRALHPLLGVDGLRGCEERLARHRAGSGLVDSLDRRFEVRTEAGIGELVLGVLPRSLVGAQQLELLLGQVVAALHHRFLPCPASTVPALEDSATETRDTSGHL